MASLLTFNLDGTERQVWSDLWRIWLLPDAPERGVVIQVQVDPEAPIRWEELDRLPELVEIRYHGRDARLQEYLATRPHLMRLGWSGHGQGRLDFSGAQLAELSLNCGEQPLEVYLPAAGTLQRLALEPLADPGALRIHAPEQGAGIYLMAGCPHLPEGPYALPGLERLRALSLTSIQQVRLEQLLPYRELEDLTLVGPPGALPDLQRLAEFPKLRRVQLRDCYELGAEALPELSAFPALESLEVNGVRQADAVIFKKRLAGLRQLTIRGKRSDAWLRANLQNAFREWPEEHGLTVGEAAMTAYRKAALVLDKAGTDQNPNAVRIALEAFLHTLNRLSARRPFDTIQREEVADAFDDLASRTAALVPLATTREWFDEWEEL